MKRRRPYIVVNEESKVGIDTNNNLRQRRLDSLMDNIRYACVVGELQEAKRAEDPNNMNPTIKAWSAIAVEDEETMRDSAGL
jgi:hypothetical protein